MAVRFILELTVLVSTGSWGWNQSEGWLRFVLAIGIPMVLAIIWGTFAVPNDPSRSAKALVVVTGDVRLLIELGIFAFASWSLCSIGFIKLSLLLSLIVFAHYAVSYDRLKWLISQKT